MSDTEKLREKILELTFERDNALLHVRLNQLLQKGLDAILNSYTLEDTFAKFFDVMAEGIQFDTAVLLRINVDSLSLVASRQAADWPTEVMLNHSTLLEQIAGRHAMAVFNLTLLPEWGRSIGTWWPGTRSALFQQIKTKDQQFLLVLGSSELGAFGPVEEKIAGQFISFVASTIASVENKQLYLMSEQLKERQRQIEQSLVQSEKMASLGQLAAGVAHELNNPIGFLLSNIHMFRTYLTIFKELLGYYQLLNDPVADEHSLQLARQQLRLLHQKEDIKFLVEDSDSLIADSIEGAIRVRDIVQSLRRFSQPDKDQVELMNLNETIESTVKMMWGELKHSVRIERNLSQDNLFVMGRPNQVGQVFLNILMNAKQAIRHDQGVILLRSGTLATEVWISIEDNGCGIAPEHMHRLFEPFFTTKEVGKGTGLGLSLCHSIMLQHGGRIEVASELGLYSRFTLFFPLAPKLSMKG